MTEEIFRSILRPLLQEVRLPYKEALGKFSKSTKLKNDPRC
jgi:hypothetical protein